jgi:hypothetical protein
LKQQMQIWAHVGARRTTYGRNTYKDLEGGNQRLSQFSHGERGKSNHRYFCRNVIWKKMVQKMETGDWRAM